MIVDNELDLFDVFEVDKVKGSGPFTLKFRASKKLTRHARLKLLGPGVYLIEYEDEIIYIGKFQKEKNIVGVRWLHHLRTITMRGREVGFSKNTYDEVKKDINFFSALEKTETKKRHMKATGTMTSVNRVRFASQHWNTFKIAQDSEVLKAFSFHFLRLGKLPLNGCPRGAVSYIESSALTAVQPKCNREYKAEIGQKKLKVEDVLNRIVAIAYSANMEFEAYTRVA